MSQVRVRPRTGQGTNTNTATALFFGCCVDLAGAQIRIQPGPYSLIVWVDCCVFCRGTNTNTAGAALDHVTTLLSDTAEEGCSCFLCDVAAKQIQQSII